MCSGYTDLPSEHRRLLLTTDWTSATMPQKRKDIARPKSMLRIPNVGTRLKVVPCRGRRPLSQLGTFRLFARGTEMSLNRVKKSRVIGDIAKREAMTPRRTNHSIDEPPGMIWFWGRRRGRVVGGEMSFVRVRLLRRWLLGLFVAAQVVGVVPLVHDHTLNIYEATPVAGHVHFHQMSHTAQPDADHHHGLIDLHDQCGVLMKLLAQLA